MMTQIDNDVEKKAEQICAKLGREKRIPFEVSLDPFCQL